MNIGLDIDALSDSMREFATAKFDSLKLYAVEWLALLSAELVSVLLAALLMSGAVMFFLFALLVVLVILLPDSRRGAVIIVVCRLFFRTAVVCRCFCRPLL